MGCHSGAGNTRLVCDGSLSMIHLSILIDTAMYQDINSILNSGEVPNLMRPEDLEEISGIIRPILQAQGRAPTKLAIQAAFVDRVQQHLHLVLCMSPVGDAFR